MVIQKAICEQLDEEESADIVILYMVSLWEEICRYAIIQIYDKIMMERRTKVYYLSVNQKHGQRKFTSVVWDFRGFQPQNGYPICLCTEM